MEVYVAFLGGHVGGHYAEDLVNKDKRTRLEWNQARNVPDVAGSNELW